MPEILVDADGCAVKEEVLRVAGRYGLVSRFVANTGMALPQREDVHLVVVGQGADVADDWIAEHVQAGDIVVTADIPLAARCVAKDAKVLTPRGRELTKDGIGSALASRDLLTELRSAGMTTGGPRPFEKKDRSSFLQELDRLIQQARRRPRG